MNETKIESPPSSVPIPNVVEDSIASRTKENTKRPKRERSPTLQIPLPLPKVKKTKEVAPKLPDKTKWIMEEQKQFFSVLRIYGKNFEALGQCFNTRRRLINPEAQQRTFGQIRCFYYRSFRTVSKLCTFTEEEKLNIDSFELRSVLAYLCLKPKLKCFDKKPAITVLHQLIRNGSAFLRLKGQREHVSIIGKALKPPKTASTLGAAKQTERSLSKHVKIILRPASANAYMRVALSCRYPQLEVLLTRTATIFELIDKLTHYWQLNNHAQSLFKDSLSQEQLILYPHVSHLSSSACDPSLVSTDNLEISSSKKQSGSRSDSDHSTEPILEHSTAISIRKRNNLSESETPTETTTNTKSNLTRTAILLATKRATSNSNTNNQDTSTFTLMENVEDEADSAATLFKQRCDFLDFIDEFPLEDEIEHDANVPTSSTNTSTVTLLDLSQGITKCNSSFSTLTIGELQKLFERPKEIRLTYDFTNLLRTTNTNESSLSSSTAFLHYVIQMANQCLTTLTDRQSQQVEMKVTKKTNNKKQCIQRSKCYCSCCSHQQALNLREQRRPSAKTTMPLISDPIVTNNEEISSLPEIGEQSGIFDTLSWPATNSGTKSQEPSQVILSSSSTTTIELPSLSTLLLPMINGTESTSSTTIPRQSAIMFSSNNGIIDDPLIQSLAAEQAASAHNYDLLSHRHKRVRRPLRYGDQSTRPINIQLLLDANTNAQQTTAPIGSNKPFVFNTNNITDLSGSSENPNDLLNDNTNMSTISLSTTIVNAALQSNISRLRLDWPDNMSDLSFGSFPDLLESNTSFSILGDFHQFEQSTIVNSNEENKCISENSLSDTIFVLNQNHQFITSKTT